MIVLVDYWVAQAPRNEYGVQSLEVWVILW